MATRGVRTRLAGWVLGVAGLATVLAGCTGDAGTSAAPTGQASTQGSTSSSTASSTEEATAANPFGGDEGWIAYQTNRGGGEAVWLVHPDGTADHQLDVGLSVDYLLPDWSPDGTRLVFTTRGGQTEPLYEYSMALGQTEQLFDCTRNCLGDDEPAYSPDGRSVAFIRALGPLVDDVPSDCGLWLGDRGTRRVRQLTSNTAPHCDREYFPRWSPDSTHLTYHRELEAADGSVTTAVFTIRADGSGEHRATNPQMVAGEPDWSPDGRWIVFSTHPLNVFQSGGDSNLYRIHPDGTGLEQLTRFNGVRATQPKYSPDGRWIVFTAVRTTSRVLWAIPSKGGDPVAIADEGDIYTHSTWQPR